MSDRPTIAVVINPAVGATRVRRVEAAAQAWRARGVDLVVESCRTPADVREAARRLRDERGVVAAAGGDGTVSIVARELLGGRAALGVLPLGTFNHFARDADIPLDLEAAMAVLVDGGEAPISVGEVGGHVFLNNVALGPYADALRRRKEWRQRYGKWPAFIATWTHVIARFARPRFDVATDAGDRWSAAPAAWIGNNAYEHRLPLPRFGTRRRLDEAVLTVAATRSASPRRIALEAARLLAGRPERAPHFTFALARRVEIHSLEPGRVLAALDGEALELTAPLVVSVRPQALRVRLPAERSAPRL